MAAEFQYLNYYTKYSCSGAFELANPHNTACFATAFGKIKGIKGSFLETYKILMNSDSGLYLESDDYLIKAMDIEFNDGKESLYSFLSNN